ncbi:MAG: hypothetical protein GYA24_22150 [Candidatus Lokiarchaeota archaeon]|nr:hypothetical protein [Candidatus Lokiarchaeota archaeon]
MDAKSALPPAIEAFKPNLSRLGIKNLDALLASVHGKLKAHGDVQWKVHDFVCPICESYSVFVAVERAGKNKRKVVNCETCKSKSSEREYDCVAIEKLVHLIHVDKRGT